MEFADNVFYQLESADPLYDDWYRQNDSDYPPEMAAGPFITPSLKGIYWTYYEEPYPSEIWLSTATGTPPDYDWDTTTGTILTNTTDADPWVIDGHGYYDSATGKLWMSWGGGTLYVSEMDPADGKLIGHPASPEFDTHPAGWHTEVCWWSGDEWSSDWVEGPSLYKHNGYWYLMNCCGNLSVNYTIRGGRGTSPTGPFYDKDGVGLTEWDAGENEYGNTIFLGADGGQDNPGHPHIWEESGTFYM